MQTRRPSLLPANSLTLGLKDSPYLLLVLLLSIFPAYNSMVNGSGHHQLKHHLDFFTATSDYFNPWQYRVLAQVLVEGFHRLLALFFYPSGMAAENYYTSFKLFRIGQHLLILGSAFYFYRYFSQNKPLRFLMLMLLAWAFHASAYMSDFAFNTYFEVLFFLWAAWLLYSGANRWWFVPLTFIAAFNRETSLMLPFLLLPELLVRTEWTDRKKIALIFGCCLTVYAAVFFGIRYYYGFQPPAPIGMAPGWPMLRFNLTDPVTLLQLFATLGVLPLFVLLHLRKADQRLQFIFLLLVPAWFLVHFWLVWARETRTFLVPLAIVLLPVVLTSIQRSFERTKPV